MKIDKVSPFITEQDRKQLAKYKAEQNKILNELMEARTKKLEEAGLTWQDSNDKVMPTIHGVGEDLVDLFISIEAEQNKFVLSLEQRYIDSFGGDIQAVLADIQEIMDAITKEDYLTFMKNEAIVFSPTLANKPAPDAPEIEKKLYKHAKNRVTKGWNTCYSFLLRAIREQLNALICFVMGPGVHDYDAYIPGYDDALNIAKVKADSFYHRPKAIKQIELDPLPSTDSRTGNSFMLQGTLTNQLARLVPTHKNTERDAISGTAIVSKDGLTVELSSASLLKGLGVNSAMLLDIFTTEYTDLGRKNLSVYFPLEKFMELRHITDKKEARKQIKSSLETLYGASLSFKGNDMEYFKMRICSALGQVKNGDIVFFFSPQYAAMLNKCFPMPAMEVQYRPNSKYNPYSFYLLRRIREHKNMNVGKGNEDIISVATLLDACEGLPAYEEVMATNKKVTDRIITPFERDMDHWADIFSWEYCHRNGSPLTEEELEGFNYKIFSECLIHISWHNYPDQTKRLEAKREKIEAEQKRKKQTSKKKRTPPKS